MKVRLGFVSNSSSSSFVVIGSSDNFIDIDYKHDTLVVDGSFGCIEFGWGPEEINDVGSKIIFAWLQARYEKNQGWLDMLEKIVKEKYSVNEIEWLITTSYGDSPKDWAYIDHQSSSVEGENTEIFDCPTRLKRFLFCNYSSITLDNDNY